MNKAQEIISLLPKSEGHDLTWKNGAPAGWSRDGVKDGTEYAGLKIEVTGVEQLVAFADQDGSWRVLIARTGSNRVVKKGKEKDKEAAKIKAETELMKQFDSEYNDDPDLGNIEDL